MALDEQTSGTTEATNIIQTTNTSTSSPQNQLGGNSEIEQITSNLTTLISNVVEGFTSGTAKDINGETVTVVVKNAENATNATKASALVDNREGNSSTLTIDFKQILVEVKKIIRSANVTDSNSDVYQENIKASLDSLEKRVINTLIGGKDTDKPGVHDLYDTLVDLKGLLDANKGEDDALGAIVKGLSEALTRAEDEAERLIGLEREAREKAITEEAGIRAANQAATDSRIDGVLAKTEENKTNIKFNSTSIENLEKNLESEVIGRNQAITTEAIARAAAITAEATARAEAIEAEAKARAAAITAEADARKAAIEALETRLGTAKQFELAKEAITSFKPFKK